MEKIILSNIQEGVRKLGAVKDLFQHMENGYVNAISDFLFGLLASSNVPVVLYGCINSGSGSNYNLSAGSIFNNGEVFKVPAFAGAAPGGQVPVLTLVVSNAQLAYTDNTNQDTLSTRTYAWAFGVSGSGLGDFSTLTTIKTRINNVLLDIPGQLNPKANTASPTLTGIPTVPTAAAGTNTGQIASTAFVQNVKNQLLNGAGAAFDTLSELASALGNDPNFATTILNALSNETNARVAAVSNEASTRATAITNEATARTNADNALSSSKADKAQVGWTNIPLINGWTVWDQPQYRVDNFGQVHLRGELQASGSSSSIATGNVLPVPIGSRTTTFVCPFGANDGLAIIGVSDTGQITIAVSNYSTSHRYRLEGISYWTN